MCAPHRQRRFDLLVIRRKKKMKGHLLYHRNVNHQWCPIDFFTYVYAYTRKELEMVTVCYYNIGIFLVQTEGMKRKKKKYA